MTEVIIFYYQNIMQHISINNSTKIFPSFDLDSSAKNKIPLVLTRFFWCHAQPFKIEIVISTLKEMLQTIPYYWKKNKLKCLFYTTLIIIVVIRE